jgi:hypothetical protein
MSGILEIAPAGIPDGSLRLSTAVKNRSIDAPIARSRGTRSGHERNMGQRMFSKVAGFFRRLTKASRADARILGVRHAEQDRAIAEQDSDIAATASIARISPVPGAVRAAVSEESAMSPIVTQDVTAAGQRDDAGARATWWQSLPQLLSRLRRALHAPSVSAADNILEVAGARSAQWSFVPQAREFAVSRRRQSGGRVRSPRPPRVLRP